MPLIVAVITMISQCKYTILLRGWLILSCSEKKSPRARKNGGHLFNRNPGGGYRAMGGGEIYPTFPSPNPRHRRARAPVVKREIVSQTRSRQHCFSGASLPMQRQCNDMRLPREELKAEMGKMNEVVGIFHWTQSVLQRAENSSMRAVTYYRITNKGGGWGVLSWRHLLW